MSPEGIIKVFSDYGAMLVLSGVFLYFIIRVINIFVRYLEKKLGRKSHDASLQIRNDVSSKVQSIISQYLQDCDGDRLQIIEFSNSVVSVAYLPFKYMTCTYEVYKYGEVPASNYIDHVSTSLFTPFFDSLQDRDYCIFDVDSKTPPMGGVMYDIMKSEGQKKSLCAMLRTTKGKYIGYIALMKDSMITDSDIAAIKVLSSKVSALLGILDK